MTRLLVIAGTADAVQFVAGQPAEVEILATTFSQLGADCLAPRWIWLALPLCWPPSSRILWWI